MILAFGIILVIVSLVVHEAGHAIAMTRRDVEIQEVGIGIPIGKLKLTLHPKLLPYPVVIGLLPLGAYVRPSEAGNKQLKAMNYKDQAVCYSAGIIVNVVFGGLLLVVTLICMSFAGEGHPIVIMATLGLAVIFTVFRRFISLIMPIIGIASIILVAYLMVQSLDNVGGPVALIGIIRDSSTSWFDVLVMAGVISISIGQFNTLCLIPLDGGRVTQAFFESRGLQKASNIFQNVSFVFFACFFLFVIAHDFF